MSGNSAAYYLDGIDLLQTGNPNHWRKVKLAGIASNRDGIGATIRVKATVGGRNFEQMRQIVCQSCGAELIAHFGLGSATSAKLLRIEWPSGIVQKLQNIPAKQFLTTIEPHLRGALDVTGAFRIEVTCDAHRSYGHPAVSSVPRPARYRSHGRLSARSEPDAGVPSAHSTPTCEPERAFAAQRRGGRNPLSAPRLTRM
jgi:hypothetical protein